MTTPTPGPGHDATCRCTECGHDRHDPEVPRPMRLLHWQRTVPMAAACLVLVAVGIWTWRAGDVDWVERPSGPREMVTTLPAGDQAAERQLLKQTLDGTEDIARSTGVGVRLRLETLSGRGRIHRVILHRGVLAPWMTDIRITRERPDGAVHPIASRRTEMSASLDLRFQRRVADVRPRPRWEWDEGDVVFNPPPEETAGVLRQFRFHVAGVLATLGLAWCVAVLARIVGAMVERARGRQWSPNAWRRAMRRLWGGLGLAILIQTPIERVATLRTPDHPRGTSQFPITVMARMDRAELQRAWDEDAGVAATAFADHVRAGLRDLRIDGASQEFVYTVEHPAWIRDTRNHWYQPFAIAEWIKRSVKDEDWRLPLPEAAGTRGWISWESLTIVHADGDPNTRRRILKIHGMGVGAVGVVAILVAAVVRRGTVAIVRRRWRRGYCMACGQRFPPETAARSSGD